MIKPLRNKIIFQFLSDIQSRTSLFDEKTKSGIIVVASSDASTKSARWGKVLALGSEVIPDITLDTYILVEPMMWTEKVMLDDLPIWQTDDEKILAITDVEPKQDF